MQLRNFTGPSIPEVMQRVRETLGPDAVILASKELEDGNGVRITAALENEPFDEPLASDDCTLSSVEELADALEFHRLPPRMVDRIMYSAAATTADDWTLALAGALDSELKFTQLALSADQRPLMLVGLSGAGKTASAAKICARASAQNVDCSLITMDAAKAGGLAQATAFGKALGLRIDQAEDADALRLALADVPSDHLIVIDSVGVNPFHGEEMAKLAEVVKAADARPILVMPAGGDIAEAADIALAFYDIGVRDLIATRIDSARRLGSVLCALKAAGLSLMATGLSPHIAEGLTPVNPVSLARLLLPEEMAHAQPVSGQL